MGCDLFNSLSRQAGATDETEMRQPKRGIIFTSEVECSIAHVDKSVLSIGLAIHSTIYSKKLQEVTCAAATACLAISDRVR